MNYLIVFLLGMYVALATYHLFVYSGRRSDKNNLFYALIVLSFAYTTFTFSIIPQMMFIPTNARMLFWHISILFGYMSIAASFYYYMLIIFDLKKFRKITNLFLLYIFVVEIGLFSLSFKPGHNFRELSPWLLYLLIPPGAILSLFLVFNYFKKKNRAKMQDNLAIGIIFYGIFFMLHPVFLMSDVKEEYAIAFSNIGMLITVAIFARMLARNFNREHHELIETKENLEVRIIDRTKELAGAKEEIENQSKEKTAFFVNLAHETRTPATLIQNYLKKCLLKYPDDGDLQIVKRNVDKLVGDMVNFLDAEKIEQGRLSYGEKSRFDLSKHLNNKGDLIQPTAEMRGLSIIRLIKPGIEITSNVQAMDRIVNNLVDNALKYTERGGSISIELKEAGKDSIDLAVADTGVGIPEDKQGHIFDKYYQISHMKGNTQGIGMGLFITKSIVEHLGGAIALKSDKSGTRFTVRMPRGSGGEHMEIENVKIASPMIIPTKEQAIINYPIENNRETVLLVEDNVDLLVNMREGIIDEYNVICAKNGKEALDILNKNQASIIISDVMMDVMDGYELLKHVRKREDVREVPFVFLTAKSGVSEEIKGLTSGAIDYIQKPFDIESLKAKIHSILEYNSLKTKAFELDKYRSVGLLTAGICHEILNPLAGIKGPLSIIEEKAIKIGLSESDTFIKGIGYVKANVNRIADIVGTLRSLFHGEKYSIEEIDVESFLIPIVEIFRDKNGPYVSININIPKGFCVQTNRSALTHVIMNLLKNASEAIAVNGQIKIEAKANGSKTIIISDNGCGIKEENINKIFDLSFTTKKESGGTGLGLYIVKEITSRLEISILVKSQINNGTEIILGFKQ